jgi:RHH-type rel operon transcriptional repressor/antitoxin RelB
MRHTLSYIGDAMLAVRVENDLESRLAALAKARGSSKSELVREAILRLLEDEEDANLAATALSRTRSTKTLAQLRKQLGLDG